MRSRDDHGPDPARRSLLAMTAMGPMFAAGITSAIEHAPNIPDPPPELARAMQEHARATFRNDIAVLADLVADDYLLVNSDSTLQDKQSYLADFTVSGFRLDPYVLEQPMLKIWRNTALAAGRVQLAWRQDGKRQNRVVRIAHLWVENEGKWRLTYTQLTRVI